MLEMLLLVLAGVAGFGLGVFFFGGLWWTVRRGLSSPQPAMWFFGSLLVRMGVILSGFYLVGGDHWQRLLSCLLGFAVARIVIATVVRSRSMTRDEPIGAG